MADTPTSTMFEELKRLKIDRQVWAAAIKKIFDDRCIETVVTIVCPKQHQRTLSVKVFRESDETLIAKFQLSFMPGCKGVLISHASWVHEQCRRRGIGRALLNVKEAIAKDMQISMMMATVRDDNDAQKYLFATAKNGFWRVIDQFINKRTASNIVIYHRELV